MTRSAAHHSAQRRLLAKVSGYIVVPLISTLSPLLVIPAISSTYGAAIWAQVALAQSIGTACMVVVEIGWGLTGPQRVARARPKNRPGLYAVALTTMSGVAICLSVPIAMVAAGLAPRLGWIASVLAISSAFNGLSPVWFFIGMGSPRTILIADTLPRVALAVLAAAAIGLYAAPLATYGAAMFLAAIIPPVIGAVALGAEWNHVRRLGARSILLITFAQTVALRGRAASALYIALPMTLVRVAAPGALTDFAVVERLERMALSVLQAVPNALQSWMGGPHEVTREARTNLAVLLNATLGAVAAIAFFFLGPLAVTILFRGTAQVPTGYFALAGLVIFISCTSRATGGLGLVSYGQIAALSRSAMVGAAVGVPAILLGARVWGGSGALCGEIVSEAMVLAMQTQSLRRLGALRGGSTFKALGRLRLRVFTHSGNGESELKRSNIQADSER